MDLNIEEKFFETYEIEPRFKKGEYYLTQSLRFAEVQAEKDIPWVIDLEKLWELENIIGSFEVEVQPGPMDEKIYCYKHGNNIGRMHIGRKDALLDFMIENVDLYKYAVQYVFPEHERRFEPTPMATVNFVPLDFEVTNSDSK